MDGAALTSDSEFGVERRMVFQTGGGCALSERAARAARRGSRCSSSRLGSSLVVGPWFEGELERGCVPLLWESNDGFDDDVSVEHA